MTVRFCWWRKLKTVIDLPQVTDKPDNIKVWFDGSLAQAAAVIKTTYVQRKSKQFKKVLQNCFYSNFNKDVNKISQRSLDIVSSQTLLSRSFYIG
jgi:hypothetical protein